MMNAKSPGTPESDNRLIRRCRSGDSGALRLIYQKHKHEMLALAQALLPDRAAAEDVVHDVFVSFARAVAGLEVRRGLRPYLRRAVVNRARNVYKLKSSQSLPIDGNAPIDDRSPQVSPEELFDFSDSTRRVAEALDRLPYPQREAVVLHLQQDMTFRAIAELRGESPDTIRSRCRYGLAKLRSLLEEDRQERTI